MRYLSTWQAPSPGRQPIVQERDAGGTRYLYARSPVGPAWIVPSAEIVAAGWDALQTVASSDFDPRTRVVVESTEISATRSGGFGRVVAYDRQFNSIQVTADAPQGGYLVVSEVAYPAWQAQLDGFAVPIFHADYLLQAVWLSPGTHHVVLSQQSTMFQCGLGISLATIFGLACFLVGVLAGTRLARPRRAIDGAVAGAVPQDQPPAVVEQGAS